MKARLAGLWRSMPLRLALLLVLLFATVSLLSLAASYAVTQRSFEQAIRADLAQDMAGFRAAPSAGAVARLVEAESRETDPNRLILSYIGPDGRIYGNGAIARDNEGYHIVSLGAARAEYTGVYLTLTDTLYGGLLTIARSRAEITALREVFVNILLVSLLPTVLIALSGGLILARRSKRHVEVIRATLDRLTTGDLAARVAPGPRWSDDLLRIGEGINQMARAQETSVAALRQVSLDIAHDLKTPIQRVSVHLDDLARAEKTGGDREEPLARARAELDGIAKIFQSLLQLAQVERGDARAHFAPVDLADLCRKMAELYEPAAADQGKELRCDLPEGPVLVEGDEALLGQLLANLIENALRHSGSAEAVEITLQQTAGETILSVADRGPGIPAEDRGKVLQRLYRLDRSRGTPGHGLGLALVDGVAKLHGARLELADNAPGLLVKVAFSA
ncbi:HAMP domain-containing sensor histidine kinase [Sulfitobacter delicatus]|uniref:histidine kinase n=1 Tax=Sulfitobacter delicatus TaxID=218672 RepID=A0A1G7VIJ9_9RHOB|nr:HAMP domain-containing sensor histidine kinase [Sulfitobacter delicatus]SDG59646.1 Signal transduction histidine kinase [Sulfitobacter delicatus]